MSFLAQLRQQKSQAKQQLSLNYLIHTNSGGQVWLTLALCELKAGLPSPDWQTYSLQAQHLEQLPAFLEPTDRNILKQLCQHDHHWVNSSSRKLATPSTQFVGQLLKSERCFYCTSEPKPGPIGAQVLTFDEEAKVFSFEWQVQPKGQQILNVQLPSQCKLILFDETPFSNAYALDASNYHVTPIEWQHENDADSGKAMALAKQAPILTHDAIQDFIKANKKQWIGANLPLPKALPSRKHTPMPTAVLSCITQTQNETIDILKLAYRYNCENFCIAVEADHQIDDMQCWDGETLHVIKRDAAAETAIFNFSQQALTNNTAEFSYLENTRAWQTSSIKAWINLFLKTRKKLSQKGVELVCEPGFRYHFVEVNNWHAEIDTKQDYVQLTLDLDVDGSRIHLKDILDKIREYNNDIDDDMSFIQLDDGRLLLIPIEKLLNFSEEFGDLVFAGREALKLENSQISRLKQIDEYLPEGANWQGDTTQLEQAINIHKSPAILDSDLDCVKAELRPYQWLGLCWLQHLNTSGVNGLLADDMGLGKTLQTISFISFLQKQDELNSPVLIVLPTSLLHNWTREIDQFAPHLSYLIMHGPQRHQHWPKLQQYNVLLTSYQLVANDIEQWQQQVLSWAILDEAQLIKNPQTKISQAVKCLPASRRLCLSGTPVENHLGELWSIFDFLMPGCLGDKKSFKHQFRNPIEKDSNSQRLEQLLERISPFILRRNKDQVAKDLPPKTITPQYIQLSEAQQQFYEDIKTNTWLDIQDQLEGTDNNGQQQILLLSAILKLRQACCDPALLGEDATPSAKREHCLDMLSELVDENRSILVFSQFTSMLDILSDELNKRKIKHLMLTGKSRNRQELVDQFQSGKAQIMLMSLKAGGVGLNLTAADTVIHYDPWWNDAAERQATDRAHRIGQDKPVFVYKLIAENTIEEKIAKLQEQKALLGQHIDKQAQGNGEKFSLALEDLLALVNDNSN